MSRGELLPSQVENAIAAGPNLVSYAAGFGSYVNIPEDDYNVNSNAQHSLAQSDATVWGHTSNTGVGLSGSVISF